jgi:hypothetical protein
LILTESPSSAWHHTVNISGLQADYMMITA